MSMNTAFKNGFEKIANNKNFIRSFMEYMGRRSLYKKPVRSKDDLISHIKKMNQNEGAKAGRRAGYSAGRAKYLKKK